MVRYSKPMRDAYFFFDATLQRAAATDLEQSARSFSLAAKTILLSTGGGKEQKAALHEVLNKVTMLADAGRARAKLNWKGLLLLHKYLRSKSLILTVLRHHRSQRCAGDGGDDPSIDVVDQVQRTVHAFYADIIGEHTNEYQFLRGGLRLTVEAVWVELLALLRANADLCEQSGLDVNVLEALGPMHATVLEQLMAEAIAASQAVLPRSKQWAAVVIPSMKVIRSLREPQSVPSLKMIALGDGPSEHVGSQNKQIQREDRRNSSACDRNEANPSTLLRVAQSSLGRAARPGKTSSASAMGAKGTDISVEPPSGSATGSCCQTRLAPLTGARVPSKMFEGASGHCSDQVFRLPTVLGSHNPWILR
jgi:hypothetical protein